MGFMDEMRKKAQNMSEMRDRFNELLSQEMRGELDDKGKEELQELRRRFINGDKQ